MSMLILHKKLKIGQQRIASTAGPAEGSSQSNSNLCHSMTLFSQSPAVKRVLHFLLWSRAEIECEISSLCRQSFSSPAASRRTPTSVTAEIGRLPPHPA